MSLLGWAIGFLALSLFFALQQFLGWSAAGAALVTGLVLLVLAMLTGDKVVVRR